MKNNKRILSAAAAGLLVAAMIGGYFVSAAQPGTTEDPLVSLSYINNVFKPALESELKTYAKNEAGNLSGKFSEFSAALDSKIAGYENDFAAFAVSESFANEVADKVAAKGSASSGTSSGAEYKVVTLDAGKTVTCPVGSEIILRLGSAECYAGGTPGLIDLTDGSDLPGGSRLKTNHLYISTMQNRGYKTLERSTALIRGEYTVS